MPEARAAASGFAAGRSALPLERADPSRGTIPDHRSRCAARRHRPRRPSRHRSSPSRAGPATARSPAPATTSTCSGRVLDRRDLVTGRHARHRPLAGDQLPEAPAGTTAPTARGSPSARATLGEDYDSYRTSAAADDHRRRSGPRSASAGSTSTATRTGPSSPSPTRIATASTSRALVLDSAYPVRRRERLVPSLTRNGNPLARGSSAAAPTAARATRRARLGRRSSSCCADTPRASGRCSTRSAPAATSHRSATSCKIERGGQRLPRRRSPPVQAPDSSRPRRRLRDLPLLLAR